MSKIIPIAKGQEIIVDNEDYGELNKFAWCAQKSRHTIYARRRLPVASGKGNIVYMHRVIVGAKQGEQVDHINGDGLDNRRENLRLCTHTENVRNARVRKDNTSGYKGVCWHKRDKKWRAAIRINGKPMWLGYYISKEEAARAYDEAAIKHFGEFAYLNFPIKGESI